MADILRFSSRSPDKAPGKGAGEAVADPTAYAALARFPNRRRVLSNFHVGPFEFEGRTYRTIEHAFQSRKIRLVDPAAAALFSLESGSELACGDGLAARRARKLVVLPPEKIREWDAMSADVMRQIAAAKYGQCAAARAVLRATEQAQLWHVAPRMKPVRFEHLEVIRSLM